MMSIEAMKQWRESLEELVPDPQCDFGPAYENMKRRQKEALKSIDQAIAEAEKQEPVAWGNFKEDGTLVGLSQHPEDQANWMGRKPLYTTPQQRTWVGLTDEEVSDIERNSITRRQAIRAIEAKLKEKNS